MSGHIFIYFEEVKNLINNRFVKVKSFFMNSFFNLKILKLLKNINNYLFEIKIY